MKVSVRRLLLVLGLCCALFVALAVPGTASAHTTAQNTLQQHTVANDTYSYWFNAGFWGNGYCFNHAAIENWDKGSGKLPYAIASVLAIRFPVVGGVAGAVLLGYQGFLEWLDHGRGVCIAWAYGSPYLPVAWGR